MKNSIFYIFLLVSTICFSQDDPIVSPKIAIKIPLGEMIQLENHTITFKKVLEDSRCPKDVNCIWAGRAKILIEISENGKESYQKELIFGEVMQGESSDKVLFTNNERRITAMKLVPYPDSTENKSYILLIYVEK